MRGGASLDSAVDVYFEVDDGLFLSEDRDVVDADVDGGVWRKRGDCDDGPIPMLPILLTLLKAKAMAVEMTLKTSRIVLIVKMFIMVVEMACRVLENAIAVIWMWLLLDSDCSAVDISEVMVVIEVMIWIWVFQLRL